MKVFIDLASLNGTQAWRQANDLLTNLGIETDYWSRTATEITDEQAAAIQDFSQDLGSPIMSELSDEEFANCSEVSTHIGRYTESSWQRGK